MSVDKVHPNTADYIYPVGSIYLTTQKTLICPLEVLGYGKWKKVSEGRLLQGANTESTAGTMLARNFSDDQPAHDNLAGVFLVNVFERIS